jgi:quinoprotein glucose dehydrogenase
MPAFRVPDHEIWAMVAYVKSISTVEAAEAGPGDPARGQELFEARCTRCHRAGGDGGRLGPDLTRIGTIRSRDALIRAIREPGAAVGNGYRTVTVVTAEGERIRGAAKGEDAFSIQIMDTQQQLRGFSKTSLEGVERDGGSLMPAFTDARLPGPDLDDIVRYLGTLRGDR